MPRHRILQRRGRHTGLTRWLSGRQRIPQWTARSARLMRLFFSTPEIAARSTGEFARAGKWSTEALQTSPGTDAVEQFEPKPALDDERPLGPDAAGFPDELRDDFVAPPTAEAPLTESVDLSLAEPSVTSGEPESAPAESRRPPGEPRRRPARGRIEEIPATKRLSNERARSEPRTEPTAGQPTEQDAEPAVTPDSVDAEIDVARPEPDELPAPLDSRVDSVLEERPDRHEQAAQEEGVEVESETAISSPNDGVTSSYQPESPSDSADLFAPRQEDERSPQAWLERLRRRAKEESSSGESQAPRRVVEDTVAPAREPRFRPAVRAARVQSIRPESARPDTPHPLPTSTRRFLRPLVGVDPVTVRVHRDPVASQAASEQDADAFAVGDDVILSAEHISDAPETLGLLAHELTHVARERSPRFVPPVLRRPPESNTSHGSSQGSSRMAPRGSETPADEEEIALEVEAGVRDVAQEDLDPTRSRADLAGASEPGVSGFDVDSHEQPQDFDAATTGVLPTAQRHTEWGGLPAPWEPMPAWVEHPPMTEVLAPPEVSGSAQNGSASTTANAVPAMQRAERGRNLDDRAPAASSEQSRKKRSEKSDEVEPDLDALAQQVYSVLRKRLALERRRIG